jgi:NAD+ kinase
MIYAIIGNTDKPGLRDATLSLVDLLTQARQDFRLDRSIVPLLGAPWSDRLAPHAAPTEECVRGAGMVFALGGDGTILHAARVVGALGIPILGINLGKLGFLAEVSPEALSESIGEIVRGQFRIEERLVLAATSPQLPGREFRAVNDFVVDKGRSSRLIDLETSIDGAFAVTYRGDGLIVSTPTGSTAYALSNGGPIVAPTSRVFGITPISPHTLSGRPLVLPDTSTITIAVRRAGDGVLFSADGQEEAFLTSPAELVVRRAPYALRLVKRAGPTFFDVLRAKLFWGQDLRGGGEERG